MKGKNTIILLLLMLMFFSCKDGNYTYKILLDITEEDAVTLGKRLGFIGTKYKYENVDKSTKNLLLNDVELLNDKEKFKKIMLNNHNLLMCISEKIEKEEENAIINYYAIENNLDNFRYYKSIGETFNIGKYIDKIKAFEDSERVEIYLDSEGKKEIEMFTKRNLNKYSMIIMDNVYLDSSYIIQELTESKISFKLDKLFFNLESSGHNYNLFDIGIICLVSKFEFKNIINVINIEEIGKN